MTPKREPWQITCCTRASEEKHVTCMILKDLKYSYDLKNSLRVTRMILKAGESYDLKNSYDPKGAKQDALKTTADSSKCCHKMLRKNMLHREASVGLLRQISSRQQQQPDTRNRVVECSQVQRRIP